MNKDLDLDLDLAMDILDSGVKVAKLKRANFMALLRDDAPEVIEREVTREEVMEYVKTAKIGVFSLPCDDHSVEAAYDEGCETPGGPLGTAEYYYRKYKNTLQRLLKYRDDKEAVKQRLNELDREYKELTRKLKEYMDN